MLSFFRNFTKSRVGLIVIFVVLGVIALAFAAGDVTGIRADSAGSASGTLVKVGNTSVTEAELRTRIQRMLGNLRQQGQSMTMEQFLAQGGFEYALDDVVTGAVLTEFAQKSGMSVSRTAIDAEIAGLPQFQGINGKFDQKLFDAFLQRERFTTQEIRDDIQRSTYFRWLMAPVMKNTQMSDGVLAPYASLLLERRTGIAGFVRTIDMDPGPKPDDKALLAWYNSNKARYMLPERRILRFAVIHPDQLKAQSAPSEAEIADAYAKSAARYAATEKRSVSQLVLIDQATANRVAGEVKGGKAIADVAKAAGLEPARFDSLEKADLTKQTSPAVADAAFAAAEGGVAGPVRSPLGWVVLKVEKVEKIAAKTLAQAHDELAGELTQSKTINALATLRQTAEDAAGDGATFDELMAKTKLQGQRTPALTAQGANPDDAAYKPDPALAPIVQGGFAADPQDQEPQVIPVGQDGSFAVVGVEKVVPAAARPFAAVRDTVLRDYATTKGLAKARTVANQIVQQLNRGVPMQQALAAAGVSKPPAVPFDMKRADLEGKQVPPHVMMAFRMAAKKAKLVEAPNGTGYYVIYLDAIEQHDARNDAALMGKVRAQIKPAIPREAAQAFVESMKRDLKVTRNEAALARFKASLATDVNMNR